MIKKIILSILIILSIISNNTYIGYCCKLVPTITDPIIYNYIYNNVDNISSEIDLIAKKVFFYNSDNSIKTNDDNLKQIKYLITQIQYLINNAEDQYNKYSNDKYILNGLYAVTLMLDEYRFSLTKLEEYILADTPEEKYSSLQSFFIVNSQAKSKLNEAKSNIPK